MEEVLRPSCRKRTRDGFPKNSLSNGARRWLLRSVRWSKSGQNRGDSRLEEHKRAFTRNNTYCFKIPEPALSTQIKLDDGLGFHYGAAAEEPPQHLGSDPGVPEEMPVGQMSLATCTTSAGKQKRQVAVLSNVAKCTVGQAECKVESSQQHHRDQMAEKRCRSELRMEECRLVQEGAESQAVVG
uniref:Uncharacterized protein n=1 Tax=Sphaerodactylus townsendi TaxID=933632 RepID=A0ACB8EFR4_9SAUR